MKFSSNELCDSSGGENAAALTAWSLWLRYPRRHAPGGFGRVTPDGADAGAPTGFCVAAGVAFFLKQVLVRGRKVGTPELDGARWTQYPESAR